MEPAVAATAVKGITDGFLERGILGMVALVSMMVAVFMFRKYEECGKRERALYERYVAAAGDTEGTVRDLKAVVEAFIRRVQP